MVGVSINDDLHVGSLSLEMIDSGILDCSPWGDSNALKLGKCFDGIPKAVNVTCAIDRERHLV